MSENELSQDFEKARALFEKAEKAGEQGNFDEGIALYIEGLRLTPDAVHEGHVKLRELSAHRQAKGGHKASESEVATHQGGETPRERMLNAEYLLAKDPSNLHYAEAIISAAMQGSYRGTVKWIADLMFLANNRARHPSLSVYIQLKDAYELVGRLDRAISAVECAIRIKGQDDEMASEMARLSEKSEVAATKQDEQGNRRGGA